LADGADRRGAVPFACSRNAARSPIATSILKHLAGRRVYVDSAGVRAGEPDPFAAAAVMEEMDIDLSAHEPKSLGLTCPTFRSI
jgi:protein-tyrosine-phosphatase